MVYVGIQFTLGVTLCLALNKYIVTYIHYYIIRQSSVTALNITGDFY